MTAALRAGRQAGGATVGGWQVRAGKLCTTIYIKVEGSRSNNNNNKYNRNNSNNNNGSKSLMLPFDVGPLFV